MTRRPLSETSSTAGVDLPSGRWGHRGVLFAMCLALILVVAYPLLDPQFFGLPGIRAGAIVVLTQFMAIFGFFFVGLQYLQLISATALFWRP